MMIEKNVKRNLKRAVSDLQYVKIVEIIEELRAVAELESEDDVTIKNVLAPVLKSEQVILMIEEDISRLEFFEKNMNMLELFDLVMENNNYLVIKKYLTVHKDDQISKEAFENALRFFRKDVSRFYSDIMRNAREEVLIILNDMMIARGFRNYPGMAGSPNKTPALFQSV